MTRTGEYLRLLCCFAYESVFYVFVSRERMSFDTIGCQSVIALYNTEYTTRVHGSLDAFTRNPFDSNRFRVYCESL